MIYHKIEVAKVVLEIKLINLQVHAELKPFYVKLDNTLSRKAKFTVYVIAKKI